MATTVGRLLLCRPSPGGGARWRFIATSPAAQLSPTELTEMRNELFNKEKSRQLSLTPRTEKIEVKHVGKTDPGVVFLMNKNISTPYSCAMHLSEWYCRKSILALVDGQPWDMYKPLTKSCEIKFLTFKDPDPREVNKAYWHSCAMIMGCVVERAFKDEYAVSLVRAPEVPVIAGAFCYDIVLDKRLDEWMPTKAMKGDRDRDPHWSTGLKSQGSNQKQKEREHKQGTQDREGCTHTQRQWGCSIGNSPRPAGLGLKKPGLKPVSLNIVDNEDY
ncbi:large ribosomal subunit protein mL39 isoform X4 [Alexandromys fortis]|uniref:large ribosomal subunit protein mL39 isoform X4 n=1 Tax=Alexandromys fortis TaxID=100897 RepID=UPI00215257AC|nr:39S ribosomal protein L39, mitochondrial isoform X4 [Microtus fortis]